MKERACSMGVVAIFLGALVTTACNSSNAPAVPVADTVTASEGADSSADTSTDGGLAGNSDVQAEPSKTLQWAQADLTCNPQNNPSAMPATAREYASLCAEHGLGVPPTVSCDEAVRVPTVVNGKEVFESVQSCEHTSMLKPACNVGSKIGRIQGKDAQGNPLPDVVWIYFCRAAGETIYSSVQMIAYHYVTGATCFFEANEGKDSYLKETIGRDEFNGLTGQMPAPDDPNFDRAFIPAPGQCVQCHQNNPFIRNPWLDGARLPEKPSEPVLPTVGAFSPYYVVGGADWDMRTIHIEGNACLSCHRIGMEIEQIFKGNGFDVNTYMPPQAPGSMADDYQALLDCWQNGPETTPGCEWIIPPAGECSGGIVGPDYPYASADFNNPGNSRGDKGNDKDAGKDDDTYDECAGPIPVGEPCTGEIFETLCVRNGQWFWCENGVWQSK